MPVTATHLHSGTVDFRFMIRQDSRLNFELGNASGCAAALVQNGLQLLFQHRS